MDLFSRQSRDLSQSPALPWRDCLDPPPTLSLLSLTLSVLFCYSFFSSIMASSSSDNYSLKLFIAEENDNADNNVFEPVAIIVRANTTDASVTKVTRDQLKKVILAPFHRELMSLVGTKRKPPIPSFYLTVYKIEGVHYFLCSEVFGAVQIYNTSRQIKLVLFKNIRSDHFKKEKISDDRTAKGKIVNLMDSYAIRHWLDNGRSGYNESKTNLRNALDIIEFESEFSSSKEEETIPMSIIITPPPTPVRDSFEPHWF